MQKKFNFIYEELVTDRNDIIGHIAYSIYKQDKIDYIKSKRAEGIEFGEEMLQSFHDISSSESSIESYKMKAEIVIKAFFDNTISEISNDLEEKAKENHLILLRETVKPLTTGFWKSVGAGILSAFIFALILAAIAFIIQFQGSSINIEINKEPNTEVTQ